MYTVQYNMHQSASDNQAIATAIAIKPAVVMHKAGFVCPGFVRVPKIFVMLKAILEGVGIP
jgi:hypothetical protein